MHSSYLITGEFVIILIISIMALWNIFRSAGNKFTDSQRGSNFEFIVYVAGELALSLFVGHIILIITSFVSSFIGMDISYTFSDKFALTFSFLIFVIIHYRTKYYQNQDKEERIRRAQTQKNSIANDLEEPVEIIFCRTRYHRGAFNDILHPEEMFRTKVQAGGKVEACLKNDDAYGFFINNSHDKVYFDLDNNSPKFDSVSKYLSHYREQEMEYKEMEKMYKHDDDIMEDF